MEKLEFDKNPLKGMSKVLMIVGIVGLGLELIASIPVIGAFLWFVKMLADLCIWGAFAGVFLSLWKSASKIVSPGMLVTAFALACACILFWFIGHIPLLWVLTIPGFLLLIALGIVLVLSAPKYKEAGLVDFASKTQLLGIAVLLVGALSWIPIVGFLIEIFFFVAGLMYFMAYDKLFENK